MFSVLELFFLSVDNSEFMRNGDYVPNRLEAQRDAANLVCGTKTQANRESTVGLLKLAGKGPELLVSSGLYCLVWKLLTALSNLYSAPLRQALLMIWESS